MAHSNNINLVKELNLFNLHLNILIIFIKQSHYLELTDVQLLVKFSIFYRT